MIDVMYRVGVTSQNDVHLSYPTQYYDHHFSTLPLLYIYYFLSWGKIENI